MNYRKRRDLLLDLVTAHYGADKGMVMLFAPCEHVSENFIQDSNFYYFSGVVEPASVMTISNDHQMFYKPLYPEIRSTWVDTFDITMDDMKNQGFDDVRLTGDCATAIHIYDYFDYAVYKHIIALISDLIAQGKKIFTIYPAGTYQSVQVRHIIDRLGLVIPDVHEHIVDISHIAAQLRRKKDMTELELLYKAVDITGSAHQAAMHALKSCKNEAEIQATLEFIFTEQGATKAYPSIVAGGERGTILHYATNNKPLLNGQLVVVDAGARYKYYCADITRTYPVSGIFTQEQKELYELVLECQELVAEKAQPGVWVSNHQEQEASLHHIAVNFFKQHKYEKYFTHSIGHFLGLDVHDAGDIRQPLQEGDVITIEPGLYFPEKKLGIRIEDNYWIVDQATPVCLSESIPKTIKMVEELVQQSFDVDL